MAKSKDVIITVAVPGDLLDKALAVLDSRGSSLEDHVRLQLRRLIRKPKVYGLEDVITFGKYRGEHMNAIIRADPSYATWCLRNIEGFTLSTEALEVLSTTGEDL